MNNIIKIYEFLKYNRNKKYPSHNSQNILKLFPYVNDPKFKKSYDILSKLCEKNVVMHSLAVSLYTYELGLNIKNKGHTINLDLAVIGALLHDIGRSLSHGIDHGVKGGEILRKYKFSNEIVLITERHIGAGIPKNEAMEIGLPPKDYIPITLEEKLVAHCDNLISDIERVDITYTINKLRKKLLLSSNNHPAILRILRLNNEINNLLNNKNNI
ncbi:TIGR00295 family protein [Methanothermococcus sp. SCGC AD-155-M21]|nr:TIGR00295 family protein [Methanothermococcus sp. SCGC AD-155-M21]